VNNNFSFGTLPNSQWPALRHGQPDSPAFASLCRLFPGADTPSVRELADAVVRTLPRHTSQGEHAGRVLASHPAPKIMAARFTNLMAATNNPSSFVSQAARVLRTFTGRIDIDKYLAAVAKQLADGLGGSEGVGWLNVEFWGALNELHPGWKRR